MNATTSARRPISAPPLVSKLSEVMWPIEAASFTMLAPFLVGRVKGDGHPVLVLPGFVGGDASTRPLRWAIRNQGYWAHGWKLGQNLGPTAETVDGMRKRLQQLAAKNGERVSIVGWSLGGVYARALAREFPHLVRQVISLGSPFRMLEGDRSTASGLYDRYRRLHDASIDLDQVAEQHRPRLDVPSTAVYSRRDGVAPWQTCIDEVGPLSENIEVNSSHVAMGFHPAVTYAVLDRLRAPYENWQHFSPPLALKLWYPNPVSWEHRPSGKTILT